MPNRRRPEKKNSPSGCGIGPPHGCSRRILEAFGLRAKRICGAPPYQMAILAPLRVAACQVGLQVIDNIQKSIFEVM
jgi:hypothetical protein